MVAMLTRRGAENQEVVNEYKHKVQVTADFIHESLECLGRIAQSI